MPQPKLKFTYWDMPGGRGEPTRLAMIVGGIEFEDHRIGFDEWPNLRDQSPFFACPFLTVDGFVIAQSNTISRYVGRLANLYPSDPWQAALCDEILDAVEDMWVKFGATMRLKDPDELKTAREALVKDYYNRYLQTLNQRLKDAGGQFFADGRLTIADLQLMVMTRALGSGKFDHIATDIVKTEAPELHEHMKRVLATPAISEYYAKMFAAAK